MGIVGRRVCIKCEFYRNVDSKIIGIQLIEGREWKLFYRGGVRQGRKRFIVRGYRAGTEKFSEELPPSPPTAMYGTLLKRCFRDEHQMAVSSTMYIEIW